MRSMSSIAGTIERSILTMGRPYGHFGSHAPQSSQAWIWVAVFTRYSASFCTASFDQGNATNFSGPMVR